MHLVGFVIRIYHDARSPELLMMDRGIVRKHVEFYSKINKFEKLVHLVGFIIRIYHDARSPELLMMDRGIVRKHVEFYSKKK